MQGIIYKYTSPSNKCYIGQTVNPKRRQRDHKSRSKRITNKFYTAIRKYGFESFKYEVLFTIDSDDSNIVKQKLDFMERYYIHKFDSYNNGYNMTDGGNGGSKKGHPMSDELKKKLSERMKKNNPAFKMTDEWRQHIGDYQRGKPKSEEFKCLQSERMKQNNPMKNPESVKKMLKTRNNI